MYRFDIEVLYLPAIFVFVITVLVSLRVTRAPAFSILAALVKSGLFVLYFSTFFDKTYTFLDDWTYLEAGINFVSHDIRITNISTNWETALLLGGGEQFAYALYNAYAIRHFGEGYYAPVAFNIVLTVAVAWLGTSLAGKELELPHRQRAILFGFLLLHPDVVAWSNVMNGKDILVLFLHVVMLFAGSLFFRGHVIAAAALAIPSAAAMWLLRFYVPVLFATALVSAVLIGERRLALAVLSGLVLIGAVVWLGEGHIEYAIGAIQEHFVNPAYGFVHILLTPIPFNTEPEYRFLDFPALIHWLLMPALAIGVLVMYRLRTQYTRFFLLYFVLFIALYAVYGELQGPRHRVQLDYAFAVFQFLGMRALFHQCFGYKSLHRRATSTLPAAMHQER